MSLEGLKTINGGAGGRSEIGERDQILQVVGEAVQNIVESTEVGVVFERVSIFQNAAGSIVAVGVDDEWVVGPFANFV